MKTAGLFVIVAFIIAEIEATPCTLPTAQGNTFPDDIPGLSLDCQNFTDGQEFNQHTIDSIKIINIYDSFIPKLKPDLLQYHNVVILTLRNNSIKEIEPEAFGAMLNLYKVVMNQNEINEILEGTFYKQENLRELDLAQNKFESVSKISLTGLNELTILDLSHNYIRDVPSDSFKAVPTLRSLNLANNRVHEIQLETFKYIPNLNSLNLHKNFLKYFDNSLKSLEDLDLSYNNISKVLDVPPTITLNISNNVITGTVKFLYTELIDLSYNNISEITIGEKVKHLALNHNNLRFLNNSVLGNPINLERLDLKNNKIVKIQNDSLSHLIKLEKLDLSGNGLSSIPLGFFENLDQLLELDLSHNVLKKIELLTFSGLNNLSSLHLNNNALKKVPENSFYLLRNLRLLYLNNNLLENLNLDELLKAMPYITTITLGNNKWDCLQFRNTLSAFDSKTNSSIVENGSDLCNVPANSTMYSYDFKNSKFYQFFDKDFVNSSFYKFFQTNFRNMIKDSGFFKYFHSKVRNTDFFKVYEKKNDKGSAKEYYEDYTSTETTTTEDDYNGDYFEDAVAHRLLSNSEQEKTLNEDFAAFANKVTLCVIINVGIIMILIFFIMFVFICRTRRHI